MSAITANCAISLNCELTQPVKVQYIDGNMFSMDNAGNTAHVYVFYDGEPQEISGSISATVIRADGSTVAVSGAMSGNRAYVIFPQAAYAVPGVISVVIKATDGTTVTTIAAFVANVYRSSTDTIVDPGTIIPSVSALIAQIEAAVDSIPADYSALLLMLAKNYSSSKPYIVGEYAWEAGVLKRCIVPITAGETYTAAHWTDACLGDDLTALKSAFDDVSSATRNIWIWGDQNVTGVKTVTDNANLPAGTYTMSAKVVKNESGNVRMVFYKNSVASGNVLANPVIAANSRNSVTFTLAEKADIIRVYSAPSSSSTVPATWQDVQIESGSQATAYMPPLTAEDFLARERLTPLEADMSHISSDDTETVTYTFKDKSGTRKVTQLFKFVAGVTYTISAKITSSATDSNSRIYITDYAGKVLSSGAIAHDGARHSYTFTALAGSARVYFWAASTVDASDEKTISVTDFEITEGSSAAPYFPDGITAVDYVARNKVVALEDAVAELTSGRELLNDLTITGSDTMNIELPEMDFALGIPVVFCDAMFTRSSGVTDYPRVTFLVTNSRGLERNPCQYKMGEENVYEAREWRVPPFIWGKKVATIKITVPTGCELTIRKLGYRLGNSLTLTRSGLRFYARPGDCNMTPELSIPCMQMALRSGYDTFTVIPKISSDGVWFAYHDDKWDISTTSYREMDGDTISDTTYNNMYFSSIPFDYLTQFSAGYGYGPAFYDIKTMKLEECFEFAAKTGMKIRFSMHPSYGINTPENLTNLKRLVAKYGLLKDLTIIVNHFDELYPAFGNDIGGYVFGNSVGASWSEDAENRVDACLTNALQAKTDYPTVTVPISCAMWTDSLFTDKEKAEELVEDILDEGFIAESFSHNHVGIDGSSHLMLWSEDYRWLMSIGVTGFTDGYNTSIGLNW